MTNKILITSALSTLCIGAIGCTAGQGLESDTGANRNRYEVIKVRETSSQVEFYMMDKETGRICYTTASLSLGRKDDNGCLLQPFSP